MDHYYHYRPKNTDRNENREISGQPTEEQRSQRKILKKLFAGIGVLLVVLAILTGGLYLYVTQAPIANNGGRTNILILGVDEVAQLSDTIMIASIQNGADGSPKIALVSIPRDLYVNVPEYGGNKINAAYSLGENNDYTGGGPGLTADTIESEFDIPMHYYASLDFEGFKKIIDSVGGVEVDVQTSIDDPYYPAPGYNGYEPFSIKEGTHTFDGETALKYARSRKTTNDYDRAYRQQQVILAVRDEIGGSNGIPHNYNRVARVLRTAQNHLDTNINRFEMMALGYKLRNVKSDNVPRYVIDTSNLLTSSPEYGALIPRSGDFEEIKQFLDTIFTQESVSEFEQQF